jgi:hypothetical protein
LRGFARTCVFAKQSLGPIHCDTPELAGRTCSPGGAPLLPKLRGQYAEFLGHASLVHLRLLASPTCVGLRYGRPPHSPRQLFSRADSRRLGSGRTPPLALRSRSGLALLRRSTAVHKAARPSFHGPWRGNTACRAGPESSPAVHRLRLWGLALGPASPCADRHGAGTLGLTVRGVLTRVRAYSIRHPHFRSLQGFVPTPPSRHPERSPTARGAARRPPPERQASAGRLTPTILGAHPLDW